MVQRPTDALDASSAVIPDLLRCWAAADPGRTALVVDGEGALDYGGWEGRSNAVARGLLRRRVRPGDRVALYFDNVDWLGFAVAYLGVLKAGGIAVPLSGRLGDAELTWILGHCEPVGMLHGRVDPAHHPLGWHAPVAELAAEHDRDAFQVAVRPADIAEVLYTSGTTGRPKGVACTHRHTVRPLLDAPDWYPPAWRDRAGGIYLHANSVSTAAGQLRLLEPLGPLGMTTVALPVFDAERFCELIDDHGAAVVQLVPAMALTILETGAARRHDLTSLRVVVFGCAPLPPSAVPTLAAEFSTSLLVNMYELSEARHAGTYAICTEGPAGQPRGATLVRITGEDGRRLPAGEVGEIRLRWADLPAQSYYRDPDATAAVFGDGWTRTGDAGRLDGDGRLMLVDRIKDVIIVGGHSISSVEIEDVLYQHPAVAEVAVFGVPHEIAGEEVYAAVVLREDVSPASLRAFVAERLSEHKVPRRVVPVEEIPRNRSGKPLKRQLRERFAPVPVDPGPVEPAAGPGLGVGDGPAPVQPAAGPGLNGGEGPAEAIRQAWRQVLGVEPDVGADFFTLGGDSLRASQVTNRLCAALGVRLTVADLFEHRTVAALTEFVLAQLSTGAPSFLPPIRPLPRPPELLPRGGQETT